MADENTEATIEESTEFEWWNMTFPPKYVTTRNMTDSNGKEWTMADCHIPDGTMSNGIDLSGYTYTTFANDRILSRIANGEPVTVGVRLDEGDNTKIELWKGVGDDRSKLTIRPQVLSSSLKESRESYAAARQAEREADVQGAEITAPETAENAPAAMQEEARASAERPAEKEDRAESDKSSVKDVVEKATKSANEKNGKAKTTSEVSKEAAVPVM